jgi:hypothetical protein
MNLLGCVLAVALALFPTLQAQRERQELVVVGIFHPKPARSVADIDMESVHRAVKGMGAYFPIAVDAD